MKFVKLTLFTLAIWASAPAVAQDQMPDVQLTDLYGEPVSARSTCQRHTLTAFIFWATWCNRCTKQIDDLASIYEAWQSKYDLAVTIVSVDTARQAPKVRAMIPTKGWEFDVLMDPNGELKRALVVGNIPRSFVFDKECRIVSFTDSSESDFFPDDPTPTTHLARLESTLEYYVSSSQNDSVESLDSPTEHDFGESILDLSD